MRVNYLPYKAYWFVAALLLVGVAEMPYSYYTILRIVVCGIAVHGAYSNYIEDKSRTSIWWWSGLAILFNPVLVIHMGKDEWCVTDLIMSIVFAVIGRKVKKLERVSDKED